MSTTVLDGAWELTPADRLIVEAKRWGSRLRFAVLLLFYRARGRFPRAAEVDRHAAAELARALGVPAPDGAAALLPDSDDRTLKRQRAAVWQLGFATTSAFSRRWRAVSYRNGRLRNYLTYWPFSLSVQFRAPSAMTP